MNQQLHRLVFSRRHGMLLPVAETTRSGGKAAGGERRGSGTLRWLSVATLTVAAASPITAQTRPPVTFASKLPAPANNLPVMNSNPGRSFAYDPAKGDPKANGSSADLLASGQVRWTVQGNTATFDQGQVARVVVNWDSFDIGAGYAVNFKQNPDPTQYVSALNRIWSADPSVILGSLTANREVILVNANGVYFGRGARVDTGKFVATSLSLADSVFDKGLRNVVDGSAVFTDGSSLDADGNRVAKGDISVEAGAEIRSAAGGDVLLIAPRVVNQGRIDTPQGQTVLAAGEKVYLMSSSDPKQRGLIVAVDPIKAADGVSNDNTLGMAENDATGSYKTVGGATVADNTPDNTSGLVTRLNEIHADSGSVNLVGLTVRQNGQINASTAVKGANGAIYLQAMASTTTLDAGSQQASLRGPLVEAGSKVRVSDDGGTVQIGAGSSTSVQPLASSATQIDAEVFNPSLIRVEAKDITVDTGARIAAAGGTIVLSAQQNANNPLPANPDPGRVVIAPGAVVSAAGVQQVDVDGARNQASQRLFRIELADAPVQRSGPLYRSPVYFDVRDAAAITAADVTGAAASIARTAAEHATAGGSISIVSDGDLVVGAGALLDVSGGSVHYSATTIKNTLLSQDGRIVAFRSATAGNMVAGVQTSVQQTAVPAYSEGSSGGTLTLDGARMALAGTLAGHVLQGERQRDGSSPAAAAATLAVGSGADGTYTLGGITLSTGTLPPLDASIFSNPLQATLPGLSDTLALSLDTVAAGGFGNLVLRAAHITQPGFGALDLGAGGTLDMQASTISLNGAFSAAGGRLSIVTPVAAGDADQSGDGDIHLSATTQLNAAGLWTNDTAVNAARAAGTGAIQPDGGKVTVASAHSLALDPGVVIDVSAGARLSGSGSLAQGQAGALVLSTGTNPLTHPTLSLAGATLRGFDFATGGSLTIGAPALTIATAGSAAGSGFSLDPGFFSASGFGNITVNALGDVREAAGTQLTPQLLNWQWADGYRSAPSGAVSPAVAVPALVDPQLAQRQPVSLALNANRPLLYGGSSVTIERGASIELDPGAVLQLSASHSIDIGTSGGTAGQASTLTARGGSIGLAITGYRGSETDQDPNGFLADQAIWLGADARLSVSGTTQLRKDGSAAPPSTLFTSGQGAATPPGQRVTGAVLGGGTITLDANRGDVVAEAGSSMALDGAAGTLNYPGLAGAVQVAKPAGTLTVSSPEGIFLDGAISAHAPLDAAGRPLADGGHLSLSLGAGGVLTTASDPSAPPYPTGPRSLHIGTADGIVAASGAVAGSDLNASLGNGIGDVRAALLQTAGFGAVQLAAGDLIRFDNSLQLNLPLGLQLNAPAIAALPGVQVSLGAAWAQIGDRSLSRTGALPDTTATADTSAAHDTQLHVSAASIEVDGNTGLQGFSTVAMDAGSGDIRFTVPSPTQPGATTLNKAQLNFAGTLALTAGQVYATSASQFALSGLAASGDGDPGSQLTVRRVGAVPRAPLSAFGGLSVDATDIDQGGVLRQPFGSITLKAERTLTLGDDSVTSVSGDGAAVPFGQTTNLIDWSLPGGVNDTALPVSKGVSISAPTLVTAPTALVSARGGGLVQASEFFPGVGGSSDYFDTAGLYAVLPDYAGTQALSINGGVVDAAQPGRQIVITMPGSGLAPGRYTLQPARYALIGGALPQGAFLVSRASDQGKAVLRAPLLQDDGSVVVTGSMTETGSSNVGAPGERFVVEAAATYLAKSEIRLSNISDLLASRAASLGQAAPALPRDAGQVQINASGTSTALWRAGIDLAAVGGQAGQLDIAATRVALVDDLAKTPAGALGIGAQVLGSSGAGSVLLGGLRSLDAGAPGTGTPTWTIDASGTAAVTVDLGNTALKTEELLLAASGGVSLAAGTQIAATASGTLGARTLVTSGDGAFAAVSANPLQLQRSASPLAGGDLVVGAGSVLAGPQLLLDATGSLQIDRSAGLQGQALALGARRLVLGDGSAPDPAATVLAGSLLAAVQATPDLSLRAYSSIDFVGTQHWSQRPAASSTQPDLAAAVVQHSLVLDAPVVRGLAAADGTAASTDIAAQDLTLRNSTGQAAAPDLTGAGSLLLQAVPPLRYGHTGGLTLGPGAVTLAFGTATLRSSGDIVMQGSGSTSAQQDLTLQSARLTAATAADQSLTAAGTLDIAREAAGHTLGERVGQGAQVVITAATLQQNGLVDLPGGQLTLQAGGVDSGSAAVTFGAGSSTSVAGFTASGPDGFDAFGAAGTLRVGAAQGRIDVLGTLDVSAARRADGSAGEGDAGSLLLQAAGSGGQLVLAPTAALHGNAGSASGDLGGRLVADVTTMASADALALAATAGGMTRELSLRVHSGDLSLGQDIHAQRISLSADAGSLSIGTGSGAMLDASSAAGGVVQLAAGNDLVMGAAARIDARSQRAGANGGDVLLASSTGRVRLDGAAVIDASGDDAADGRIVLRALRGADNASVNVDALNTASLRAGEVDIEAVRVYGGITTITTGNSSGSTLGQATMMSDSAAFMSSSATLQSALGITPADAGRVQLRAGVEVRSSGDLTVAADWALNADQPGNDAGFLTLRAAGNLAINGSLSDGFSTATSAGVLSGSTHAWSFRLAGGADLSAANPLSTVDLGTAATDTGNLGIAAGKFVRTGAGSIELAAGRDIRFAAGSGSTPGGLAYVAGRPLAGSADLLAALFPQQPAQPIFSEHGGRLTLDAARDITAPEARQLINNWFWRSGLLGGDGSYAGNSQLAWWTQFSRFQQTLGSFGGGSIEVNAGRDILNLQAMAPSAGWADSTVAASAALQRINGGEVTVDAGRNLLGGQFLLGLGTGRLRAGGTLGDNTANVNLQAPVVALLDGSWRVSAREDLIVGGAFDPTAAPSSAADNRARAAGFFYTWGAGAGLQLVSNAGTASLHVGPSGNQPQALGLDSSSGTLAGYFQVLPPSLVITAPSGDIELLGNVGSQTQALMFPSATGRFLLWSGGSILLGGQSHPGTLAMSDSDPSSWPDFSRPADYSGANVIVGTGKLIPNTMADLLPLTGLHRNDAEPAKLHADASLQIEGNAANAATLLLPKSAELSAGEDIIALSLRAQNLDASDSTRIDAGRNVLAGQYGGISVAGPGALELTAGRGVDLGASAGLSTTGNVQNPSLPAQGASISITAANAGTLDLAALDATYLQPSQSYRDMLLASVRTALNQPDLTYAQAWALFQGFPAAAQAAFGRQVLAAAFGTNYLAGAAPDAAQMTATLQAAFEQHKTELLAAGAAALTAGSSLTLPGREVLQGAALSAYLDQVRGLSFAGIDIDSAVAARVASLARVRSGWRDTVAASLGSTSQVLDALLQASPQDPLAVAYGAALGDFSGRRFEAYRSQVLASEVASTGAAAALYGRLTLPMRLALFDQGFQAAELAGVGSFVAQPIWPGTAPLFSYNGALEMTQSSVVTERGGSISLVNAGGAIDVGLKQDSNGSASAAKGVIALGGGDIFGLAKTDFQVNTQRVFVVGSGNMTIWSSSGDIDSGRGANTAVAAPPLAARRSVDGVVFETPATTTGSGLGIVEDAAGQRAGTIGLYPAFGEILALDAFIRAPSVVLGSTIKGADNLQAASVGGAAAPVSAPPLAVAPPSSTDSRAAEVQTAAQETRPRNALLTVELLGLGAPPDDDCSEADRKQNKCPTTPRPASPPPR